MRTTREYEQLCPVAVTLDVIGDRWALLILRDLLWRGPHTFQQVMSANPGLSPSVLSTRLRELADDGLVERIEPGGHYRLTERGLGVEPIIDAMYSFGTPLLTEVALTGKRLRYLVGLAATNRHRHLLDVRDRRSLRITADTSSVDVALEPGRLEVDDLDSVDASIRLSDEQLVAVLSGAFPIEEVVIEGDVAAGRTILGLLVQDAPTD